MSPAEFESGIQKLKNKNPGHDILIVIQERGYDPVSVEYLRMAIAEPVEDKEISLIRLHKEKDMLYSRRAVLSNKFHECVDDKERKEVSVAVMSIQTEIIEVRRMLNEYYETGKLPKPKSKYSLPLDGRAQQKKLRSVQSSLSRFRGLLRKEQDVKKIKHYEKRIADLTETARELSA